MKNPLPLPRARVHLPAAKGHFGALINDKHFLTTSLNGVSCLRPELIGVRTCRIWKIHAVGQVARHRTLFGLFIDHALVPGVYDLAGNERITVIYHLTPKRMSTIVHSRDVQQGRMTLLECGADSRRLRGIRICDPGDWLSSL